MALCLLLLSCSSPAKQETGQAASVSAHAPRRIVSMNPCVDAILHDVADPNQIAGISHYSHDPRATSVPFGWAHRFPAVGDEAEDVVAMEPDLVVTGPHVAPQTAAALKRLGIPILMLPVPATVPESQAQIATIANAIGREPQGRAAIIRIERAVAAARQPAGSDAPSALIWQDGGLVPGPGTLADDLLQRAGFRSASAQRRLAQWEMVSLEDLLWAPPDIVMTGRAGMETDAGNNDRVTRHPALSQASGKILLVAFPSSMLHCGGPVIARTMMRLAEIRRQWRRERGT